MKGQRMLVIVSVAIVLAGAVAGGQTPPPPPPPDMSTEPPPEPERPLGDEEAMVLNFERADIRESSTASPPRSASATRSTPASRDR